MRDATLILIAALMLGLSTVGCAHSVRVYEPEALGRVSSFVVMAPDDPIGVAPVIAGSLQEGGYEVSIARQRPGVRAEAPPVHMQKAGSGFFVSARGDVVTNSHVVGDAGTARIVTSTGHECTAVVQQTDANNDLALLKTNGSCEASRWLTLSGYSTAAVGEQIYVVGYPLTDYLGTDVRVTEGIISSGSGLRGDPTRFQISAPIQPGNSGGPIVAKDFTVIGIATERLSDLLAVQETGAVPQNVNFGVKADYAKILVGDPEPSDVSSLPGVIQATVMETVGEGAQSGAPEPQASAPRDRWAEIHFRYTYYWDVFHHTLTALVIDVVDPETGTILAQGSHSGGSLQSYVVNRPGFAGDSIS